ncbi:tetratricopeptide repeat protein [Aidingimonas lacisalsi]|uniref:tetratricopeptide repeat protein n=1 Tax=Aidingimonas lacisalsi TaxID=2604086 RepID=UPI0011D1A7F5|nr:tetratricopeptide repeat protein [Aidingimonas lacisalsi]
MRASLPLSTLALASLLSLTACQGLPMTAAPERPATDPMAGAPPIEKGLDADGLATLLTAEFAGQRGDYQRASRDYLKVAERYDSIELIERAALAARFADDRELLESITQQWQRLAPDAEAPMRLLGSLALQRGDWEEALKQRLALIEQGGQGELTDFANMVIDQGVALDPLLERLHRFLDERGHRQHPQYPDIVLATAQLEAASGNTDAAQARLESLSNDYPELPQLWLARSNIAIENDRPAAAREAAQRGLELAPDDDRFILLLAQSELMLGNPDRAEVQTDTLLARHPDNEDLRLAVAQLYLDEDRPAPARRLLLPLANAETPPPRAFIQLGQIAAEAGETDNALLYYRQVPTGEQFIPSRLLAARMLIEENRLDDAREFLRIERLRHEAQAPDLVSLEVELLDDEGLDAQADRLLDRSIETYPDTTHLRYLRAMRAFEDGNIEAMERDLQRVIDHEPDNATALNALGYTLADTTERHAQARKLIERAHELEPDNPAILDSLGWVHHKLGNHERALPYLERAYAAMPDQEVAAHLIEVLWELDRRDEARRLLDESMERFETRPRIDELINRLPDLTR